MAFWKSGKSMRCLWIGCIVLGLVYAIFFIEGRESLSFVLGQVSLGLIGLARESVLSKGTSES